MIERPRLGRFLSSEINGEIFKIDKKMFTNRSKVAIITNVSEKFLKRRSNEMMMNLIAIEKLHTALYVTNSTYREWIA